MEEGASTIVTGIIFMVILFVFGWLSGQIFTWRRLKRPLGHVSSDGGIDYLLTDVKYKVTTDNKKRTNVELASSIYETESIEGKIYISVETFSPSPVADEMHRIHNAGAMICSLRPAERRGKHTDNRGDRPPVTVVPSEKD